MDGDLWELNRESLVRERVREWVRKSEASVRRELKI